MGFRKIIYTIAFYLYNNYLYLAIIITAMKKMANRQLYLSNINFNQTLKFRENLLGLFQIRDYFHVLLNLDKGLFEFCGQGVSNVLGYGSNTFSRTQLIESIHPEDLQAFVKNERKIIELFNQLSSDAILENNVRYTFRIRNGIGVYKRLMRQLVCLEVDDTQKPLRVMSEYSDITCLDKDTQMSIGGQNDSRHGSAVISEDSLEKSKNPFSEREIEILKSVAKGESVKEIANNMKLSVNTINNHKCNMLRKAACRSCHGLICKALRNHWI